LKERGCGYRGDSEKKFGDGGDTVQGNKDEVLSIREKGEGMGCEKRTLWD